MPPVYSTTLFPDVKGQAYQRAAAFVPLVSALDAPAGDQSTDLTGTQMLWLFAIGWDHLQQTDAQNILHAVEIMGGDTSPLYFFEWPSYAASSAYVGLGDGTSNPFTLPVKASSGVTVTDNGGACAGTVLVGTGTNGEDQFDPAGSVTAGHTLRASWTAGRRRRKVRLHDGSDSSFQMTVRPKSSPIDWQAVISLIESEASEI